MEEPPNPTIYTLCSALSSAEIYDANKSRAFLYFVGGLSVYLQLHLPYHLLQACLMKNRLVGIKSWHFLGDHLSGVIVVMPSLFTMYTVFVKSCLFAVSEELIQCYHLLTTSVEQLQFEKDAKDLLPTSMGINDRDWFRSTDAKKIWKILWLVSAAFISIWTSITMIWVQVLQIATMGDDYSDFVLNTMGSFFVLELPFLIVKILPRLTETYERRVAKYRKQKKKLDLHRDRNSVWELLHPLHDISCRICDLSLYLGLAVFTFSYWVDTDSGLHRGPFTAAASGVSMSAGILNTPAPQQQLKPIHHGRR